MGPQPEEPQVLSHTTVKKQLALKNSRIAYICHRQGSKMKPCKDRESSSRTQDRLVSVTTIWCCAPLVRIHGARNQRVKVRMTHKEFLLPFSEILTS